MGLANLIGQTLDDKYKIERELGRGGMGAVYLATHVGTERAVAVKVIAPEFMRRQEFVERFRREARAAGRLRHPNVVDVTDFGIAETSTGSVAYLVMEYLDGCTLGEILEEEKRLPLSWTLDILEQTCSAVDEAHRQGIIHRDLKPDNIWLEPNAQGGYTVKVLDFGIAKLEEPVSSERDVNNSYAPKILTEFSREIEENKTIALPSGNGESATLALPADEFDESGTMPLIPHENGNEGGTAIFPVARQTVAENNAGTNQEAVGTRILASPTTTDKVARDAAATSALTRVGAVLGTPLYMSPEQCRGEKLDPRADVYSLGVIAYQMLSGDVPFKGDYKDVLKAHKNELPPPLEAKNVRHKVKQVVMSALAKDKDERPISANAFASRLRAHSEGVFALFRKAFVIYSENLPKFLTLALLMGVPMMLSTFAQVAANMLTIFGSIDQSLGRTLIVLLSFATPLINIFFASVTTGVTTWLVAQHLAVPLRPISLRPALAEARKHLRTFGGTVMGVSLLSLIGLFLCFVPGFLMFIFFSLVTPVVMMEGLKGRAALRRSIQLVKRSWQTVTAVTFIHLFVPIILTVVISVIIGLAANGISNVYDKTNNETTNTAPSQNAGENGAQENSAEVRNESGVKVNIGQVVVIDNENAKKNKDNSTKIKNTLRDSIFQLIWLPFAILIGSLASVVTALLYLKTRRAGGEMMQDLLAQFEETELPQSRWQIRVKERLAQSGRVTNKTN